MRSGSNEALLFRDNMYYVNVQQEFFKKCKL